MNDLDARVRHEVERVHADLARWLGTEAPPSVLHRFLDAQHPEFSMVTVSGDIVVRDALTAGLSRAGNSQPGLAIDIEDVSILARSGDLVVVRFTERHHGHGTASRRLVTATLTLEAADGPRWLTVHETARG